MKSRLRIIIGFLCVLAITLFVLFVIQQTTYVVDLAERFRPGLGTPVLYLLLAIYAACLIVPFFIFLSYPKPLRAPSSREDPNYQQHLERLRRRLSGNPYLEGALKVAASEQEIEQALAVLGARADEIIRKEASMIFVITAVSQSGRFDALSVLLAQTRVVWRLARLYYQRPTIRDMTYLYGNIAAATFVAMEIEDLDLDQQLEPMITGLVAGSAVGAIPGVSIIASYFVSSVMTGAANALLTLRVGTLTKRYCASLTHQERRFMRRSATLEAVGMLGGIIYAVGTDISKRTYSIAKRQFGEKLYAPVAGVISDMLARVGSGRNAK